MNMFKVVCTYEHAKIYFTAVPYAWENEKILYWPDQLSRRQRENLRCRGNCERREEWKKIPCVIKETNIRSFDDACEIEEELNKTCDTDMEEEQYV